METRTDHQGHIEGHTCEGCETGGHEGIDRGDPAQHDPVPPVRRFERPDNGSLVRAIGLLVLSLGSFFGAVNSLTHFGTIMAPVAAVLGTVGMLSMWGAMIHVTGGERFDDHPWV
jgi:hypothetical protein